MLQREDDRVNKKEELYLPSSWFEHDLCLFDSPCQSFYHPHIQPIAHQFDERTMGERVKDHDKA